MLFPSSLFLEMMNELRRLQKRRKGRSAKVMEESLANILGGLRVLGGLG
jgi:hypothetical protein